MRKHRRGLKAGDTVRCSDKAEMIYLLDLFSKQGMDVKPTGEKYQLVICGVDKRRKCK